MSEEEKQDLGLGAEEESSAGAGEEETVDAGTGASDEEDTDESAESEEAGSEEEEETDERGVPLKNRIAELDRKLQASQRQVDLLMRQIQEKTTETEEKGGAQPTFKEIPDAEFAKLLNTDEATVKGLRRLVNHMKDGWLAEVDQQHRENVEARRKEQSARWQALVDFNAAFGDDEVGRVFKEVNTPSGTKRQVWDEKSPLLVKAREILKSHPEYGRRPDGEIIALHAARAELLKERAGSKKPTAVDEASKLLGKGGSRGGAPRTYKKGGEFTRTLSDEEYDKLPRAEKDAYDKWEVMHRKK